jgi:hypothetical protein
MRWPAWQGVNLNVGRVFDYGFDGTLLHVLVRGNRRVESGFHVDIQMKATTVWEHDGDLVVYDLEAKTYNDLVTRDPAAVGCVLILLCMPKSDGEWLAGTETEMVLRHCCYWARLEGEPTYNAETKRIRIPRTNLLTADSIHAILEGERMRRLGS